MSYTIQRTVDKPFDRAVDDTIAALEDHGFGVLTDIDVTAKFDEKLDVDFRDYRILGACNPPYAYDGLSHEIELGALLPCNVIVYETENGETGIAAVDPEALIAVAGDDTHLESIASDIQEGLKTTLESV